jgi:uncharacterized heparinase superfamily protein
LISHYFHTIRYLKFKQIYYRVWFHLTRPSINKSSKFNLRTLKNNFCLPIQKKSTLLNREKFFFLNKSGALSEIGWNDSSNKFSKLWRYNQHYFDDLNALGASKRKGWHKYLITSWINENSTGNGIGWEPYTSSLRIVNWIKWHLSGNSLSDTFAQSLEEQAQWLAKRIEWHILGNHLFSNAKALVFAGLFFSNKDAKKWLKTGLKIIHEELNEQVLNDGGNFERSPMYHSIFLEDLLDLINIARAYEGIIAETEIHKWVEVTKQMLKWLDTMVHPDGEIAFFNDAALGVGPDLKKLMIYANRLGINYNSLKFEKVTNLSASGYIRLTSKEAVALLDVAAIGPDYLPGHAHADTLSFELSLFGQRLLVNTGTSEYGTGSVRQHERSTKAHNTVMIDNKNSSETWKGFRVARRAYPINLNVEEQDEFIRVSCAHDGYKRLTGKPVHQRTWQFFGSSFIIKDNVEGSFESAFAYFHLHPKIHILKNSTNNFNFTMSNGKDVTLEVKKGIAQLEKSYYSPEFGKKYKTRCLKVALDKNEGSSVKISW